MKLPTFLTRVLTRELILYGIFGVLTTVVNVVVFALLRKVGVMLDAAVVAAWVLSVVFAFFTNRTFVFASTSPHVLRECAAFFAARVFSGAVDVLLMHFLAGRLFAGQAGEIVLKVAVNIIVIVLNYVASKFWVFPAGVHSSTTQKREGANGIV